MTRIALFAGFLLVLAAVVVGLEVETDLSPGDERLVFSALLLVFALVVAFVRHRRTGRWGPTDEEALENARDLGSNRQLLISVGIGIVAGVVGAIASGAWVVAPFVILLAIFNGLVDRTSWRWFAKRKARKR
ncbi:MAG: hypothetical protein Q7T55_23015 [Solirubrobacteraceae bacterium]|nr:hypothetical protein [Solirubrobacteraceae bacterium]